MTASLICLSFLMLFPGGYPKADLLLEPATLMRVKSGSVIILDVRGKSQYAEGHIPGARWIDAPSWDRAFDNADRESWSVRLGAQGLDPGGQIVVYGGDDVRDAARIWWILRYWGFDNVRLLNGGWSAWKGASGSVSTEQGRPKPMTVVVKPAADRLATKEELLNSLKEAPPQIVDARSQKEFCGLTNTAKRNGSVPGAIHLEWTECLDPQTKRFKAPDELRQLLEQRKIDVNQPAVTYCQSGGRASVVAFTLELMGGRQVKNYYKSWSEWGNAKDTPVQKNRPNP